MRISPSPSVRTSPRVAAAQEDQERGSATAATPDRRDSKQARVIALLQARQGATIATTAFHFAQAFLCEPVSVTYRTGLRHAETEIENWRAETGPSDPPVQGRKSGNCRPETRARQPNPRECRQFSHTRKSHRKDHTGWLCWQSAANCSAVFKFPDHRENTGNIADIGPSAHPGPLENQPIGGEIP
jgi:hypothetical protein